MSTLRALADALGLTEREAEPLIDLCAWVDAEIVRDRRGYPADDEVPAPIEDRLSDSDYLSRLLEVASEAGVSRTLTEALRTRLGRLALERRSTDRHSGD